MKLIRSIAMNTDHTYHGEPIEVTRIDLWMSEEVMTPEAIAEAKKMQVATLHGHAKSMPHRYWQQPGNRPYAKDKKD